MTKRRNKNNNHEVSLHWKQIDLMKSEELTDGKMYSLSQTFIYLVDIQTFSN